MSTPTPPPWASSPLTSLPPSPCSVAPTAGSDAAAEEIDINMDDTASECHDMSSSEIQIPLPARAMAPEPLQLEPTPPPGSPAAEAEMNADAEMKPDHADDNQKIEDNEDAFVASSPSPSPVAPSTQSTQVFTPLRARGTSVSSRGTSHTRTPARPSTRGVSTQTPTRPSAGTSHAHAPLRATELSLSSPFTPTRSNNPHPYARLFAHERRAQQAEAAGKKTRRQWTHALESRIFSSQDLCVKAAYRRPVYIASLEAHIDELHTQLIDYGLYPIQFKDLAPYKGISAKLVKATIAGLQTDLQVIQAKQTEIECANTRLRHLLDASQPLMGSPDMPDLRALSPRSATLLPAPTDFLPFLHDSPEATP